ncbi:MAG: replicative DNA helicase [Oscillospiraceae bacterium]|nr:replicative DNA helicase [Oscillospiraceae bacterium]
MNNQIEIQNQSLPYSIDAEQAVLGAVLLDSSCLPQALEILRPEAFYNEHHREIFSAMQRLFRTGSPIDLVTVLNEVVGLGIFSEDYGKRYLFTIAEAVPSISNLGAYAKIIRDKYEMRSLVLAAREIISDAADEANEADTVLNRAEQLIYEIADGRGAGGLRPLREVMLEAFDHLMILNDPDRRDELAGVPSGIPSLDVITSGLNKSDLIILAARPGMGKTSFALNISRNVAVSSQKKVAFFSLEMTREQLALRILSSESGVSSQRLRDGRLKPDEWTALADAAGRLHNVPIYLDESGNISATKIQAMVRRLRTDGEVGLVVIDYLQLMSLAKTFSNRVQDISEITRSLKIMAKELNVPVMLLSQLNRSAESRTGHKPMLADLRDSGSIEQDADIVLFLYREGYYAGNDAPPDEIVDQNMATCIVAKNRHGGTGDLPLHWSGETTRFTAIETRR